MAPNNQNNRNLNNKNIKIMIVAIVALVLFVAFYSLYQKSEEQNNQTADNYELPKPNQNIELNTEDITKYASFQHNLNSNNNNNENEDNSENNDDYQPLDPNNPKNIKDLPDNIDPITSENNPIMKHEVDPRWQEYKEKRKQMFDSAMRASSKVASKSNNKSNDFYAGLKEPDENASYEEKMDYYRKQQAIIKAKSNEDPSIAFKKKLALAKSMIGEFTEDNNSTSSASVQTQNNTSRNWKLGNTLEKASQLTINTGFVIPAVLITAINSDLQGNILGQVSQNVYDTATGRYLLIPQGTKLYGTYSSQVLFGQERVLVAWNRLIYPNGQTLDLGQMVGADLSGASGFTDQVNNHYWKLFKGAFLLSMVTATVTYSDNKYNKDKNSETRSATSAMSEALGNELGQVTTELIRKHMNVSPTLEIRNGYRFNVIVNKDIQFNRPYNYR